MTGRRTLREIACPGCDARWARRGARYCGSCGAALVHTSAGSERSDARSSASEGPAGPYRGARPWLLWAVIVLVAMVVTVAVSVGIPEVEEPEPGGGEVDLPDPEELQDAGDRDAAPLGSTTDELPSDEPRAGASSPATCVPAGCERWRTELPHGSVTPAGGLLIHVERKVGPPSDWPDEGREEPSRDFAVLTAVDPANGRIVWQEELVHPQLTDARLRVLSIDDTLVLVVRGREITALESSTGERRWGQHAGHEVTEVHIGEAGHIVVWGPDGSAVTAPHEGEPGLRPRSGQMTSFDRHSGSLRWRTSIELLVFAEGRAVTLSEDGASLVGLDLDDLTQRWRREHRLRPDQAPVLLTDRDLGLVSTDRIEVLDLHSGETSSRRTIELRSEDRVQGVGKTVVVHRQRQAPPMAPTERRRFSGHLELARSSAYLFYLDDPDRTPTRVGDVVDVVPLPRRPTDAASRWHQPAVGGLALVSQPEGRVHLTVLDSDGTVHFEREVGLTSERCCWQPLATTASGSITLVDPEAGGDRVAILSTTDPTEPRVITHPGGRTITDVLGSSWPIVVAHGSEAEDLWLHSAGTWSRVVGRAEVVSVDPGPVIQTPDGLIGLDLDPRAWLP